MPQGLIYFIVWPFLFFIVGLKKYYKKGAQVLFFLFFAYASLTLNLTEDADISLYEGYLNKHSKESFPFFLEEISKSLIGLGEKGFEIYLDTISFLSNLFGGGIQLTFLFSGICFYFFWKNSVNLLQKEHYLANRKNLTALLLLISFSLYIIIFRAINGRFYLAYWVFVWGAYKTINNNNFKYVFISIISIYIHQSYLFGVILLMAFYIIRNRKEFTIEIFLYFLVLLGTVLNQVGIEFVSQNLSKIGFSYEERYSVYADSYFIEARGSRDRSWFLLFRQPFLFYATFFAILMARINKKILFDSATWRFYFFFLFFWAINTFTFQVHSLGSRFRNVLIGFGILLLFKIYNSNPQKKIPIELLVFFLAFLFYKTVSLRIMGAMISLYNFFPLGWIFDLMLENKTLW